MYIHSSTYLPTFLPIYRFLYIGVLPARVSIVHWCFACTCVYCTLVFGLHVCLVSVVPRVSDPLKLKLQTVVCYFVSSSFPHPLSPSLTSPPNTRKERNNDRGERGIRTITESNFFPFVSSLTMATNKPQLISLKDQQPPTLLLGALVFIYPLKSSQNFKCHAIIETILSWQNHISPTAQGKS